MIGAGVHGAATAFYLGAEGRRILLLDRGFGGRHSSNVNAGGVRALWRHPAEIPLALAAKAIWPRLRGLVGHDCGFRATGQLKVAETAGELRALEERIATLRSLGYRYEKLIDRDELRALAPGISAHCPAAIWVHDDGYGSPFATTFAFQSAAERLGAVIVRRSRVIALERAGSHWTVCTENGRYEAGTVVNCAGAWGDVVSAMVDEPVPLSVEAPMMMACAPVARFVRPVVGCVGRKLSFKQLENGVVLIGGGHRGVADRETCRTELRFDRLAASAESVLALFPGLGDLTVLRCWAGIEGLTPDRLPYIGRSRHEGLYHAFGFSSHGYQLGPIVGRVIADLVVHGETAFDLRAFSIDRFAAGAHPVASRGREERRADKRAG